MKKLNIAILAACAIPAILTSCKKTLEKQDLGRFTASQVYNDSTTAVLSLNYIYSQNQPSWFGNSGGTISGQLNGLTEEQSSDNVFVKGTATIESVTDIGADVKSGNYVKIRTINMFLRDIDAGTLPTAVKKRFKAQALFWRAYRYFELVKLYGGVPIVTTPLDAVGDAAKQAALVPRSTTSQTFAQISRDLDSCIAYLPGKWISSNDYGRITSSAALAFKGRVLLTYASPQFNPTNDQARWTAAYDANSKAVALLTANGFGLYPKWDYTMWTTEKTNPEAVLVTEYNMATNDQDQNNNTYPNNTVPKYIGTSGGSNQPTYDLVQAFPMADGKPAVGTNASTKYPYSLQTFYKNRDPRFYQTIAFNGENWPLNGNPNYRIWTYYYYNNSSKPTQLASTESSPSSTGLYLRKGIDPTITSSNFMYAGTDWIEIRYAEVLLNLAECAAETGKLSEAYDQLVKIRARAGIEPGTNNTYGLDPTWSHDDMINAIMYERQIEFAFEGKRYWDLRRRKLLESTLNGKKRSGMIFTLKNNNSYTDYIIGNRDALANASLDDLYSNYFTVSTKTLDNYNINYQPSYYFFGIPTASLRNNSNLQQNNTWGGPFDPLK